MSRAAAKQRFSWNAAKKYLAERNVDLISAGLDEVPLACKDIETVMAAQADGRIDPESEAGAFGRTKMCRLLSIPILRAGTNERNEQSGR
jgi:hypothetical protein